MAEAILSVVVERIGNLLIDEAVFLSDVRDQVEWVKGEFRAMECFLRDADEKRGGDERVKNWVRDVRDTAYLAEDLVELFVLHAQQRKRQGALRWNCLPCDLYTLHIFGKEIGQLRGKIRDIDERRTRYDIRSLGNEASPQADERVRERRRVVLHAKDADLVGMNEETGKVLCHLLDEGRKIRSVISIVGMGGIGKSTLAKRVFNSAKSQFVCSVWITVSQQYSAEGLLKELLLQLIGNGAMYIELMTRDQCEVQIYQALLGNKYLIVLDDVWDRDVWEVLSPHLPDAENGNRVLITTRSVDVARAAGPSDPLYMLRLLNEEESWELLSRKAFPNQDIGAVCSHQMKEVGKQIANKCGGLPLALVVLGGLLSRKGQSLDQWRKLAKTMVWNHSDDGRRCLDILKLSYADLPHHLKWCFLYFSSLPEDFEIRVEKLIRLWIAEGFVAQREGETLEETAEDYLEELEQRCMVTVVEARNLSPWLGFDPPNWKLSRIHDLLRDFAVAEAKETGFLQCRRSPDDQQSCPADCSTRRLSLHSVTDDSVALMHGIRKVRTLLGFGSAIIIPILELRLLRVLDLHGSPLDKLPKQIGDLIHLRYLGLRDTEITSLPSSLGKLRHLQCLDTRYSEIETIPEAVWKINALRHVLVSRVAISKVYGADLRNLQVLKAVQSGEWVGRCLHTLVTLRELELARVQESHRQALEWSLPQLSFLKKLLLEGVSIPCCFGELSSLESLWLEGRLIFPPQPGPGGSFWPPNLVMLSLIGSEIEDQEMIAAIGNLSELRHLGLGRQSYLSKEMIVSGGGFPKLRSFVVFSLPQLERWVAELGAMPCLESLRMCRCWKLATIPDALQRMTALKDLTLWEITDELRSRVRATDGEDWPKIQHVPSITVGPTENFKCASHLFRSVILSSTR